MTTTEKVEPVDYKEECFSLLESIEIAMGVFKDSLSGGVLAGSLAGGIYYCQDAEFRSQYAAWKETR